MKQFTYIEKILERFGMHDCKARATPSEAQCDPTPEGDPTNQRKYREMMGSLIYIMSCTKPDITWIVSKLSQYLSDPREKHMTVKHESRYLKGAKEIELFYKIVVNKLELTQTTGRAPQVIVSV